MDEFSDEDDDLLASLEYVDEKQNAPGRMQEMTVMVENEGTEKLLVGTVPDEFPFPFIPYDIQKLFMANLYRCLDQGKVGIFESPTGTGKSLSLICGALSWLKDFQAKQKEELDKAQHMDNNKGELDWIAEYSVRKEAENKMKKVLDEYELMKKQDSISRDVKRRAVCRKRKRHQEEDEEFSSLLKGASKDIQLAYQTELEKMNEEEATSQNKGDDDDELVLQEYNSDDENAGKLKDDDCEEEKEVHVTKIFYCSRTHSQLSQFVKEVVKSPFGENTRVTSLGSRQNLCINPNVVRLKSITLINETCLDMQKSKKDKSEPGETKAKRQKKGLRKCPFNKREVMEALKDQVLAEVMDVEQIVTEGKQIKACPYYSTRLSIPCAELVALPYNILLHKATREACGIKLDGNIVLIDEAHNLMETINSIHSVEITGGQLLRAHSQLTQYEARYRTRLKAKNLMYIKQLLHVLACLVKVLGGRADVAPDKQHNPQESTRLLSVNNFLFESGMDNINLFKLVQFCEGSLIARKLNGFVDKYRDAEVTMKPSVKPESGVSSFLKEISNAKSLSKKGKDNAISATEQEEKSASATQEVMRSPLMVIQSFLMCLTNADKDGRVVITKQKLLSQSALKFLLLNPAVHFVDILKQARSVIVAGGTMQPVSEFKDQLLHLANVGADRVMEYSCDHVIPSENLVALTLSKGPSGKDLDFTYQNRDKGQLLDELGMILTNISAVIPGGMVCFFPSYDYLKLVLTHLQKTGALERLSKRKKVFQEPKGSGQVESILGSFAKIIETCGSGMADGVTGAILMCVVGGKMSEGINFSDSMGRCVVMVGLPYPNINSPELKEKMQYLNSNFPKINGQLPGNVHYENICMKAVNQSIGRAIRHRNDYASILLLDQRYSREGVQRKLPGWIVKCLQDMNKFGPVIPRLHAFFKAKAAENKV